MNRSTVRRLLTTTAAVPFVLTAFVAAAPGAVAEPAPLAGFTGGYRTDCDLPVEPITGRPASGAYRCDLRAMSVVCGHVVTAGSLYVASWTCTVNLRDAWYAGYARAAGPAWICENGFGKGVWDYTPDNTGPTRSTTAWIEMVGGELVIDGSYFDVEMNQFVVIRATIPGVCGSITNPEGYQGTVTPL